VSLGDRGYMGRPHYEPPVPRGPWWQKIKFESLVAIMVTVAGAVSATAWFLSDVSYVSRFVNVSSWFRSREGSLIVNINTATNKELETLPGIGPALATLIVNGRPYATAGELARVRGIGPSLVESLRPLVIVEGDTRDAD
jgi:DNA uptake protein ComE-like DNA-binding protein